MPKEPPTHRPCLVGLSGEKRRGSSSLTCRPFPPIDRRIMRANQTRRSSRPIDRPADILTRHEIACLPSRGSQPDPLRLPPNRLRFSTCPPSRFAFSQGLLSFASSSLRFLAPSAFCIRSRDPRFVFSFALPSRKFLSPVSRSWFVSSSIRDGKRRCDSILSIARLNEETCPRF